MKYKLQKVFAPLTMLFLALEGVSFSQVPDSAWVEVPPVGPFTKSAGNPVYVDGLGVQNRLLPGNMVQADGKYWIVADDRSVPPPWRIILISSDDMQNWTYETTAISAASLNDSNRVLLDSPHIFFVDSTWYIFYSSAWSNSRQCVSVAHSGTGDIMGPYIEDNPRLIAPSGITGDWEQARTSEPYLVRMDTADIILYMGDTGKTTERVGMAISKNGVLGPYAKWKSNPVLPFGPGFDTVLVSDPWVFNYHGTYYIGYDGNDNNTQGSRTMCAMTTDFMTFTKSYDTLLAPGPINSWDQLANFRGGLTEFGDLYVLVYAGKDTSSTYQIGIATQPVHKWLKTLSTKAIAFGKIRFNSTKTNTVVVSNLDTATAHAFYIHSTNSRFSTTPTMIRIPPLASISVLVSFTPEDTREYSGFIVVVDSGSDFADSIAVEGSGDLTSVKPHAVPTTFALDQNYPNPFNPSTIITYSVPQATHVLLSVYDERGRKVLKLVDRNRAPGTYRVSFDGSKLASGVYYCRLVAGDFKVVRKMMLLK